MENTYFATGARPSPPDDRDYNISQLGVPVSAISGHFPEEFEVSQRIGPYSQGKYGMCVAFAVSTMKDYHERKERGDMSSWSPSFIYGNRDYGGEGMTTRDAVKQLKEHGVCPKEMFPTLGYYPFCHDSITEEMRIAAKPQKVSYYASISPYSWTKNDEIRAALMYIGPVIITIQATYNWKYMPDSSGGEILYDPNDMTTGNGHAVLIIGWSKKYCGPDEEYRWVIQNSWGNRWREGGFGYQHLNFPIKEIWVVKDFDPNTKHNINSAEINSDNKTNIPLGRTKELDIEFRTVTGELVTDEEIQNEVVYYKWNGLQTENQASTYMYEANLAGYDKVSCEIGLRDGKSLFAQTLITVGSGVDFHLDIEQPPYPIIGDTIRITPIDDNGGIDRFEIKISYFGGTGSNSHFYDGDTLVYTPLSEGYHHFEVKAFVGSDVMAARYALIATKSSESSPAYIKVEPMEHFLVEGETVTLKAHIFDRNNNELLDKFVTWNVGKGEIAVNGNTCQFTANGITVEPEIPTEVKFSVIYSTDTNMRETPTIYVSKKSDTTQKQMHMTFQGLDEEIIDIELQVNDQDTNIVSINNNEVTFEFIETV